MSKKLFLGLLLCVGLQGLNAADQGDQPAQPEPAQPDQALALVDQEQDQPGQAAAQPDDNQLALVNQERQIVAFDPNTANAHQIAVAAGTLAVRAGTELVQQSVPLVRRGINFSSEQISGAGRALANRYHRSGILPTTLALEIGALSAFVTKLVAEQWLPAPLALAAGLVAGARATSAAADNFPRFIPLNFNIKILTNTNFSIIFSSNNINFDRDTLKEIIQDYLKQHPRESLTMYYTIINVALRRQTNETRTFSLETLDTVFNELITIINEAQQ